MKSEIKFYRRKMIIPTSNGEVACYYSDLMYAKYEDPYCWLHFFGGAKYTVEVSVTCLLKSLPEKPFFRCNRTDIINLCYYAGYEDKSAMVILEDGTKFRLSVRKYTDFKKQKADLKRISPPCYPCSDSKNENCPDFRLFCVTPGSENSCEEQ